MEAFKGRCYSTNAAWLVQRAYCWPCSEVVGEAPFGIDDCLNDWKSWSFSSWTFDDREPEAHPLPFLFSAILYPFSLFDSTWADFWGRIYYRLISLTNQYYHRYHIHWAAFKMNWLALPSHSIKVIYELKLMMVLWSLCTHYRKLNETIFD